MGAEVLAEGGVSFRVWAPRRRRVEVVFEPRDEGRSEAAPAPLALAPEPDGYFSGVAREARAGDLYRFRLDGGDAFPDPASRFQPAGPDGPSEVIDPAMFGWSDRGWRGPAPAGQVVYELHAGTFTPEGTWEAAARELPVLSDLGITLLELMPVAEFAGRFGWGYDGVDLFAPTRLYGRPDDLRRFVDRAHALGLAVVLDVVYNHLGPTANHLPQFADGWLSERHETDWGAAIAFDGAESGPVREFFLANARYWIEEFHFDGLRLDATQDIHDDSPEHVVAAIARRVREAAAAAAGGRRRTWIVAESEPQQARLVRPADPALPGRRRGAGLDALWNDDFHHAAVVALTGRAEAYYTDYRGTPQELVSLVKHGFLFQGQRYEWQDGRRGEPALDLPRAALVHFLENHDQVANSARGERLDRRAAPGCHRAMTALLLLAPQTPLLFQGQEHGAAEPFLYFADHQGELAEKVRRGRLAFLAQFASLRDPELRAGLPDPCSPDTFARCKLDPAARRRGGPLWELHRDLLRLRREDPVFGAHARGEIAGLDGAVLGPEAFVLRFFGGERGDRLLVVNLGRDLDLAPAAEPLLGPLAGRRWRTLWSSEAPRYGGAGAPEPEGAGGRWWIAGRAAFALAPAPRRPEDAGEGDEA